MRRALLLLLLAITVPAVAEIWIEPPDPTTQTVVTLNVVDSWHDGCLPINPVVTRTGNSIEVVWTVRGGGCPLAVTEWRDRVHLGLFEPGDYEIVPKVRLQGGALQSYPARTLTVRDASPRFLATPRFAGTRGGDEVSLFSEDFCGGASVVVSIDGAEVASRRPADASCVLLVTMPAHAAGPADVTLRIDGVSRTWVNAFRYADPDAAPDRALAERILVPILYSGPGAFGSRWVTEASVVSRNPFDWHRFRPCSTALCGTAVGSQNPASLVTMFGQRPNGLLLFVDRDAGAALHFGTIIRDVSRDGTHGTEVPIVRESELLTGYVRLPNVTLDPSYRATLRIYGVDGVLENVYVDAHAPGRAPLTWSIERLPSPCSAVPCDSDEPAFVAVDLTAEFRALAGAGPVSIGIEPDQYSPRRYWAFISVTHNETQRVTVITPQ